jgi:polar amino acid transport system substrate-binding protein
MSLASELAPTGTLRVGVWMVPYFARMQVNGPHGIIPDLGAELARRLAVKLDLVKFENPARMVAAFSDGSLDVTFVGVTAERAQAIDFGPSVLEIETTYLVPPSSPITSIAEIDRTGIRVAVPANSAQEMYLAKTVTSAMLVPVPPEKPDRAIALLKAGEADAFSHVAPMLAAVKDQLPGSRLLPGSYFNVPIAIGVATGRPRDSADFARAFAEDVKRSGFVQQAIERHALTGVTVGR